MILKNRKLWKSAFLGFSLTAYAFCSMAGGSAASAVYAGENTPAQILDAVNLLINTDIETNRPAAAIMLQQLMDKIGEASPAYDIVASAKKLLEDGADGAAVNAVLSGAKAILDSAGRPAESTDGVTASDSEGDSPKEPEEPAPAPEEVEPPPVNADGLPIYQVEEYQEKEITSDVTAEIPASWGNNASDRALTTYSPVNDSGSISPDAGTLSTNYFLQQNGENTNMDEYAQGIASMSVTANMEMEEEEFQGFPSRRLHYQMNVGANTYDCEVLCFSYDQDMYSFEMMQGGKASFDYFPVLDHVVQSVKLGSAPPEPAVTEEPAPEEPEDTEEDLADLQASWDDLFQDIDDLSSFVYIINGKKLAFPTAVSDLAPGDLPINLSAELPYEQAQDAGQDSYLANTQLYNYESGFYKELAGVTNTKGQPSPILDGILTALIDTRGDSISISLPGGLKVGSEESEIAAAFPPFSQVSADGVAGLYGEDILYAVNVRDDGCMGYALIRNDAPYFSALSIICEEGKIIEISFECLGYERTAQTREILGW